MIDPVIAVAPAALAPGGRLLMVQNSVTGFPKSMAMMRSVGLEPRVLAERSLELRPLFDRAWLDALGGVARGLYGARGEGLRDDLRRGGAGGIGRADRSARPGLVTT